jgi:hypothetical protein
MRYSLVFIRLSISPALLHFDYTEFSTTDQILDTETGRLHRLEASLSYVITSNWSASINTWYHQGRLRTTDTEISLFRSGARADRLIYEDIHIFIAAQSNQWERDIQDNNKPSGIDETYEWHE